jgi:hypothetical protein
MAIQGNGKGQWQYKAMAMARQEQYKANQGNTRQEG